MKRIAYVSDAWHGYVSYVMPKALLDSFSDYEEDVILCHFNSFGSWSRNEKITQENMGYMISLILQVLMELYWI